MKLLIKQWRLKKGFTLTELAKRSGISKGFLSKLEHHTELCHLDILDNISHALEICPRSLLHCGADISCDLCSNYSTCPFR